MLDVRFTNKFKKDLTRIEKQGKNPEKLYIVIDSLRQEKKLPSSNHDHSLSGEWAGYRECHIEPDWLLIYKINNKVLELVLIRTGSHSELFG